jgi:hypothetical protein
MAGWRARRYWGGEGRKQFFFEKKNQKTFVSLVRAWRVLALALGARED